MIEGKMPEGLRKYMEKKGKGVTLRKKTSLIPKGGDSGRLP